LDETVALNLTPGIGYTIGTTNAVTATIGNDDISSVVTTTLNPIQSTLTMTCSAAIDGTGNELNNVLTGNSAANILSDGAGNGRLNGGLGNDTLTGGAGAEIFRFASLLNAATNVDRITDFTPTTSATTTDRIQLENTGAGLFTALTTTRTPATTAFVSGTDFTKADQRISYESITGSLFFDSDGTGPQASILFATLATGLAINNTHFQVI
jgi:serralysin